MWYVALCVIVWIIAVLRSLNFSSNSLSNSTLDMQSNCTELIKRSNFETKPTNEQAELYAQELVTNQNLITGGGLEEARQKMHWMDSITYEDARGLIAKNAMNHENALGILNF